jgi:hypothetical protein
MNPASYALYILRGLIPTKPQFLVDFEFDAKLTDHFTLFVNPTWYSWDVGLLSSTYRRSIGYNIIIGDIWENYPFMTFNVATGILYRPTGSGLRGWFIGICPLVGYTVITEKTDDQFINAGGMADFGYEWVFKNGLTILVGGGFSYIRSIPFSGNQYDDYEHPGITLYGINYGDSNMRAKVKAGIGYSF